MQGFQKLSRAEMKNVMGGLPCNNCGGGGGGGGGCEPSTCTSDANCTETKFPHCYIETCLATGLAANFCGVNP